MTDFLALYQNIPQYVDPIAFMVGSFEIRWYSLSYIFGFITVFFLLLFRGKKGEDKGLGIRNFSDDIFYLLMFLFCGMVVGGRLGYVVFYGSDFFLKNPLAIISPYDQSGGYVGIYGMSYHGAVLGIIISGYVFSLIKKIDFWRLADFVVPASAAAYVFGRIANFLNGELLGKETNSFLGVYFGKENFTRHPSQLYEAVFEGIVLASIIWAIRNKAKFKGQIFLCYLVGYSFFRYFLEYFRSNEKALIAGIFTTGQLLSSMVFLAGIFILLEKSGIMQKRNIKKSK